MAPSRNRTGSPWTHAVTIEGITWPTTSGTFLIKTHPSSARDHQPCTADDTNTFVFTVR